MYKFKLLILTVIFLIGSVVAATALTLVTEIDSIRVATSELDYVGTGGFVNSGELVGVFTGNDSNQQSALQTWLQTVGGYGETFVFDEYFKDEYSDDQATKSGQWSTDAAIMFYTVKAADAFALYEVVPLPSNEGTWSTYDLWIRGYGGNGAIEISHIAGFNTAPVPEPATMLLLGTGLIGLAGFGRKKKKK